MNQVIIQRSVRVRAKVPKDRPPLEIRSFEIGFPNTEAHIFKIGVRFFLPPTMKCRHFCVRFFNSNIIITESIRSIQIKIHTNLVKGAVSLVNGKYASLSLKQNPIEACKYGLLHENNKTRGWFKP